MCGTWIPCTPMSSRRRMNAGSNPGVRTMGVMPTRSAAMTICWMSRKSKLVCSMSMKAASKPAWPMISMIWGSAIPPVYVPSARPPSFRIFLTRFVCMLALPGVGARRLLVQLRAPARPGGDGHLVVLDVGQHGEELVAQRRRVEVALHDLHVRDRGDEVQRLERGQVPVVVVRCHAELVRLGEVGHLLGRRGPLPADVHHDGAQRVALQERPVLPRPEILDEPDQHA